MCWLTVLNVFIPGWPAARQCITEEVLEEKDNLRVLTPFFNIPLLPSTPCVQDQVFNT